MRPRPLPISSVNHVSFLCTSVEKSVAFYEEVLGFMSIKRPGSFDFDGAWLFNYGIGIHLIQTPDPQALLPKKEVINPKDNHISFQCSNGVEEVEQRLKELGVRYVKAEVLEGGVMVEQIFFHDPDGAMIEVCTCENLPVEPLSKGTSNGNGGFCPSMNTKSMSNNIMSPKSLALLA